MTTTVTLWSGMSAVQVIRDDDHRYLAFVTPHTGKVAVEKSATKEKPKRAVILDPGHGGHDSGGKTGQLEEKDLNLDLALRVRRTLELSGHPVIVLRSEDVFVPLRRRSEMANAVKNGIFVSIHHNFSSNPKKRGFELFHGGKKGDPNDASALLAKRIQAAMVQGLGEATRDGGIVRKNFTVLRLTECPSVLVEAGFLSNPAEARLIATPAHQKNVAEGIAAGISAYLEN